MQQGFGLFIFLGILFLAWLMWSSKDDKESFLFYVWGAMIAVGSLNLVYLLIK
ncbi:MAG: hypothetical protein WC023_01395 [Rhodocyclaceae bacterium]